MFRRAALACVIAALCLLCACSSCACPADPPVVVDPHVVTNDRCVEFALVLDGGITRNVCLTASQIQKVIDSP